MRWSLVDEVVLPTARAFASGAARLLRISRDRDNTLLVAGRSWQEDGTLSARYWSEATKEKSEPSGITGEIRMESATRAAGYFSTRSDATPKVVDARASGIYLRAEPEDLRILDGHEDRPRADLIAERLKQWKALLRC